MRQENMSNKSKKAPKKMLAKANMGFDNLVQGMKLKMKEKKTNFKANGHPNGEVNSCRSSNRNVDKYSSDDHIAQYNNAWRSIYSERLGRAFHYNTVAHIGQWDKPELSVRKLQNDNNSKEVNLPEKESISIKKERRPKNTDAQPLSRENSKPPLATDTGSKKRPRNIPQNNVDDTKGSGDNNDVSVAPKGNRRKKQRSIVGAFNDTAASSSKDSRSSTHVQKKEASEVKCPICGMKGSIEWVQGHIEKCLGNS